MAKLQKAVSETSQKHMFLYLISLLPSNELYISIYHAKSLKTSYIIVIKHRTTLYYTKHTLLIMLLALDFTLYSSVA